MGRREREGGRDLQTNGQSQVQINSQNEGKCK